MRYFCFSLMILVSASVISLPALAEEAAASNLTANVGLFSEYAFRGVTQSDEHLALQGGADYTADIAGDLSVYAGAWGSTVDFNDGDEASVEVDLYGGVSYPVDRLTLSAGFIYYTYPGADSGLDYDFVEIQGKILYDFGVAVVDGSMNYSPDYFAGSGDSYYLQANLAVPLPYDFTAKGHFGHQAVDDNTAFALPDYTDWSVGLVYSLKGFDTSLSYVDTDMDSGDCADGCESRGILSISYLF